MKYILTLVFVSLIILYVYRINSYKNTDNFTITPASISNQRVANLKLKQNPDRNLGILDESKIKIKKINDSNSTKDYRAIPKLEWIVSITPPKGFTFSKQNFLDVFNYEWRNNYNSTFYAHFPSTDNWSFAISGDSPEYFDSLELAVNLAPRFREDENLTETKLQEYLIELEKRLNLFEVSFDIKPKESINEAINRSVRLRKLQNELNQDVIIILQSESNFESLEFWNTLVNLGLEWGDGDLFHWNNYNDIGGNHYFSVWSNENQGYFLPEDILKGNIKPKELIFGFSIPRSADPIGVFEILINSVQYCQSKIGGEILDRNGEVFDKSKQINQINEVIDKMNQNGLKPGQGLIMRLI